MFISRFGAWNHLDLSWLTMQYQFCIDYIYEINYFYSLNTDNHLDAAVAVG